MKVSSVVILSIVMPTYNRRDILRHVLDSIEFQSGVELDQIEVIVVNDGSSDDTKQFLSDYSLQARYPFRHKSFDENSGPAKARNAAIEMSSGNIVLMLGDDIVPEKDLLCRHLSWHKAHPAMEDALLGYVTWPDEINPTPFMRWLETGGRQYFFNYAAAQEGQPLEPIFFYTCNISLKRAFLVRTELFDESFPYASHEDLELGSRLFALGMRLYLDREAVGYHWHPLDLKGIVRRMYLMGHSTFLFWQKAPDRAQLIRKVLRPFLRSAASVIPVASIIQRLLHADDKKRQEKITPFRWHVLLALAFWRGVSDGRKGSSPNTFIKDALLE
jgi:glycosyltransferase involved in cell wall biosynthesis